jgi:WD40 repeat protein
LIRFPHSFEKINDMKFKPDSNILFTCGEDGCFKSWTLAESDVIGTNQKISNWIYKSCNGYRDLAPSYVSFLKNDQYDLVIVSFNHILTVWNYDDYDGVSLMSDLIHCDSNDPIKQFTIVDDNHILAVHDNCLNLWNIKLLNNLNIEKVQLLSKCVWSQRLDPNESCNILSLPNNDNNQTKILQKSQVLLLFIKKDKNDDNKKEAKSNIRCKLFI